MGDFNLRHCRSVLYYHRPPPHFNREHCRNWYREKLWPCLLSRWRSWGLGSRFHRRFQRLCIPCHFLRNGMDVLQDFFSPPECLQECCHWEFRKGSVQQGSREQNSCSVHHHYSVFSCLLGSFSFYLVCSSFRVASSGDTHGRAHWVHLPPELFF